MESSDDECGPRDDISLNLLSDACKQCHISTVEELVKTHGSSSLPARFFVGLGEVKTNALGWAVFFDQPELVSVLLPSIGARESTLVECDKKRFDLLEFAKTYVYVEDGQGKWTTEREMSSSRQRKCWPILREFYHVENGFRPLWFDILTGTSEGDILQSVKLEFMYFSSSYGKMLTPLGWAVLKEEMGHVKTLLDAGANTDATATTFSSDGSVKKMPLTKFAKKYCDNKTITKMLKNHGVQKECPKWFSAILAKDLESLKSCITQQNMEETWESAEVSPNPKNVITTTPAGFCAIGKTKNISMYEYLVTTVGCNQDPKVKMSLIGDTNLQNIVRNYIDKEAWEILMTKKK